MVQHGATHHTATPHTWIDVIMVDDNDNITRNRNLPAPFHSKHNIIDVAINVAKPKEEMNDFQYRDYKNIDENELILLLQSCDWEQFNTNAHDTETALSHLCDNLMDAINELAPLKTFKCKKGRFPWIDAEISALEKKRDATYKRYKRTGDVRFHEEYLRLRDLAESKTTQARTEFYNNKLFEALNSNTIWKELRNLGLLPKRKEDLNGISPSELNEHFAGVSISHQQDPEAYRSIIASATEEGFCFKEINIDDVIKSVSHFSSQAVGEDGIPQSVILKALPVIGDKLVMLFNSSLRSGTFPSLWKKAHVLPLKKCSLPSGASDFRPIALLCFLSKVLEKIVHTQIMEYLLQNNILDPYQTGFRPHHSTQTALLKLTDDIRTGMDKKTLTLLLLFDFSKAFDKISHDRLLMKLKAMGFSRSVLLWIHSYLTGRQQLVITKNTGNSSWLDTNIGVPQGSVLGPLLFCLYINDVRDVLNPAKVRHLLYADDLQIYVQILWSRLHEGIAALEEAAKAISEWARAASLTLNSQKTQGIIFGSHFT